MKMLKILLVCLLLCVSACICIFYFGFSIGEIGRSNKELEKVIKKGTIIINALEEYKKDNGEYPPELAALYPEHISNEVDLVYEFFYHRGDLWRGGIYTNEEIDEWGGYELGVQNIKQSSLNLRQRIIFIYRPSKLYPRRRWVRPKKRVKDWALVVKSRRYGLKVNPIIGPGV